MIDYIINRHLDQDSLAPLRGKNIAICCNDLQKTWYILIEEKLYVVDSKPDYLDLTISSTVAGFMRYLLRQDRSLLHLSGSLTMAETLQQLVASLDIDWEELLSKYTGDVIAHQSMRFIKSLRSINLDQMLAEYLQHEARIIPGKYAVREFLEDVDQLRQDVDRLEAKIKQYAVTN